MEGHIQTAHTIKTRDVVKYATMPRVLPRVQNLFGTGFGTLAYFMALVFAAVRLLPAGHPYLFAANIGRFGLRHVFAAAFNSIVVSRRNIDQMIILGALLVAVAILFIQIGLVIFGFVAPAANAVSAIFVTQQPRHDIAFMMLDRVFGVPGLFNSCVATPNSAPCMEMDGNFNFTSNQLFTPPVFPWPFHTALHTLFGFYSSALLIVAALIIMYFVIVIAAETAQTGTPFGKRFNTVWAPIRLVVALGLLVPVANGLNVAQYMVLYAAKWGSGMATNGWVGFNGSLSASFMNGTDMVAHPEPNKMQDLVAFMVMARACQILEDTQNRPVESNVQRDKILDEKSTYNTSNTSGGAATMGGGGGAGGAGATTNIKKVHMYIVKHPLGSPNFLPIESAGALSTLNIDDVLAFSQNSDIVMRFGDRSPTENGIQLGYVKPLCGELTLSVQDFKYDGPRYILQEYLRLVQNLWADPRVIAIALRAIDKHQHNLKDSNGQFLPVYAQAQFLQSSDVSSRNMGNDPNGSPVNRHIPSDVKQAGADANFDIAQAFEASVRYANIVMSDALAEAVEIEQNGGHDGNSRFSIPNQLLYRGWGGAGIWYNRVAELNGALVASAANGPQVSLYPMVMANTCNNKQQVGAEVSGVECFNPASAESGELVNAGQSATEQSIASTLYQVARQNNLFSEQFQPEPPTGNFIFDMINALFGTQALFDLRSPENRNVHPLAQLAGVGRGLINATITNLTVGFAAKIGSAVTQGMPSQLLGVAGGLAFAVATLGLTVGFVLYYVIPFLPFLYFFFAVGTWVKGIFEAMVGMPLWALAHLRIDGNGLPGDAAMNGYYLLFEIFLRPLLAVFGLLAAVVTFAASAHVLNEIFDPVVSNVTGFDRAAASAKGADPSLIEKMRGPVDRLFFTVLYAIIMYMLAISSFKLIDQIPNNILRWMGSSVSTFSDFNQDAAQQLTQYAAISGSQIINQSVGSLGGAVDGLKGVFQSPPPPPAGGS